MQRIATVLTAMALAAAALIVPAAAHADEPDQTRVLILGDSITQGRAGDVTWRYHLWDAFRSNIDLVGPKQGEYSEESDETVGDYPHGFDLDHASRWGMSLTQMRWPVAELMQEYLPEVVVSQLGFNDLWHVTDPAGLIEGQRAFVEQVRAADPGVDVVLGELTVPWWDEAAAYNALLPALADELDTRESRVLIAVMPSMTRDDDSYDGLHPSASGEVKIAAAHRRALVSLEVPLWAPPAPSTEPAATEPPAEQPVSQQPVSQQPVSQQPVLQVPAAPTRVRVVSRGGRVEVRWRGAPGASSYVARCGAVRGETGRLRIRLEVSSDRCRVRSVNAAGASPWVAASS